MQGRKRWGHYRVLASPAAALQHEAEQPSSSLAGVQAMGKWGEDGTVQGLLELLRIPYTGSGPLSSALAMDKGIAKEIFSFRGIPTPEWILWENPDSIPTMVEIGFPPPWIVKPCSEGSTIGVSKVENYEEINAAMNEAFSFDRRVLIERYIPGKEITVGILGKEPLPIVEVRPLSGFYDFPS